MTLKRSIKLAAIASMALSTFGAALADYSLAQPAENFMVVPDTWSLLRDKPAGPINRLECSFKGVKHTWPIDKFWLADRLDSNSICCGGWQKLTKSYLEAEEKLSSSNKAAIELITLKKGGPIKVVGLWNFGDPPKYEKFYCTFVMPRLAREAANSEHTKQAFVSIGER